MNNSVYLKTEVDAQNTSQTNFINENNNSVNNYILFVNGTQSSWSNGQFVNITGDNMTGPLNIFSSLNVSGNANFSSNITFDEYLFLNKNQDHWIRINSSEKFDDIAGESFWLHQDDAVPGGEILFLVTHQNKTTFWYQSGRNESFSGHGNSQGIVPNYWGEENFTQNGIVNMSQLSNYPFLCEFFDMDCVFTADTRGGGGPLLFTTGDFEVWKQTHLMEGIQSNGDAEFILDGFDFNIVNGSLHIQTPRIQLVGFVFGDNVTRLNANFNGDVLDPFAQTTSGGGASEWTPVSSLSCHDGLCARALGGTGSPIRGMSTDFSSLFLDNMNLTFFITSTLASPDNFIITVDNNEGSGEVTIFTTSTNIIDTAQLVNIPSSMDNVSLVTLTFNFSGNNPIADSVFIDDVLVIGNATATTEANITVQDSDIKFGDGTGDGITYQGDEAIGFSIMNFTADLINFIGNTTFVNVIESFLNVTGDTNIMGNLDVGGYINASNWLDVSISSSQVTDFNDTVWNIAGNGTLADNDTTNNFIIETNTSMNNYVDSQDIVFNDSNNNFISDNNDSVNNNINSQNTSQTNYINSNNNSVNNYILFVNSTNPTTHIDGVFNSTSWNRSGTDVILANSGDSVGIGVTNPDTPLHIVGSGSIGVPALRVNTGGVNFYVERDAGGGGTISIGTKTSHNLQLIANSIVGLFVSPSGDVSIPNGDLTLSKANAKLQFGNSDIKIQQIDPDDLEIHTDDRITFQINGMDVSTAERRVMIALPSGTQDVFNMSIGGIGVVKANLNVNNGDLFVRASNGFVGIGTKSPVILLAMKNSNTGIDSTTGGVLDFKTFGTTRFQINGNTGEIDINNAMKVKGSSTVSVLSGRNFTVDTDTLFVDSVNDKVGIGTITPDEKLDVNGTIQTKRVDAVPIIILDHTGETSQKSVISFEDDGAVSMQLIHDINQNNGDTLDIWSGFSIARFSTSLIDLNTGSKDVDFRVRSMGNANQIYVNALTNKTGINTSTPATIFEIEDTSSTAPFTLQDSSNTCDFGVDESGFDVGTCTSDEELKYVRMNLSKIKKDEITNFVLNYPIEEYTWKSNDEKAIGVVLDDYFVQTYPNKTKLVNITENNITQEVWGWNPPSTTDLILTIRKLNDEIENWKSDNLLMKESLCKLGETIWC